MGKRKAAKSERQHQSQTQKPTNGFSGDDVLVNTDVETSLPLEAEAKPSLCSSQTKQGKPFKYCSRRWVLAYLLCVVRICQTALRQCIGMALVCMTHQKPDVNGNTSDVTNASSPYLFNSTQYDDGTTVLNTLHHPPGTAPAREFSWSSTFEGHVLVAYYYGFLLTVLLAGYVDRWLGSVTTISLGLALGATVNLLTPLLTRQHHALLVLLRVLGGCANGVLDPSMHSLWSMWAPISERGQLTAVEYSGNGIGGMFTFLISAILCDIPYDNGWPFVFYFYGTFSLVFAGLWHFLASNSPETHPTISPSELQLIVSKRLEISHGGKINPPWLQILKSKAVWAIIVGHVSFSWVFSWILAYLPMFMEDVLQYGIAENGALSSLPFLGKLLAGIGGGYLADILLRRRFSVVFVRKLLQMAGSVGCALPLLVIGFLSRDQREWAVAMLVFSVSVQNLTSVAYRINSLDIAPRYAGFLMGFTSTIACGLTLTAPYVTSALLKTKSRDEWRLVLYIVSAVSFLGGVVFLFFAKGDVQEWARAKDTCIQVQPDGREDVSDAAGNHENDASLPLTDDEKMAEDQINDEKLLCTS